MSNRRKPSRTDHYRGGYLQSTAWFTRRADWFRTHTPEGGPLVCPICGLPGTARTLHLHHTDYTRVVRTTAGWVAGEADDDLVALHPACHEQLHRLIDRDRILAHHRTRRDATATAIHLLHHHHTQPQTGVVP